MATRQGGFDKLSPFGKLRARGGFDKLSPNGSSVERGPLP